MLKVSGNDIPISGIFCHISS